MEKSNQNAQKQWTWDYIGFVIGSARSNFESTVDQENWNTQITGQNITQERIIETCEEEKLTPNTVIKMIRMEKALSARAA